MPSTTTTTAPFTDEDLLEGAIATVAALLREQSNPMIAEKLAIALDWDSDPIKRMNAASFLEGSFQAKARVATDQLLRQDRA